MLSFRDIHHRAGNTRGGMVIIAKFPAQVMDIDVGPVGSAESVLVNPVVTASFNKIFKSGANPIQIFGMDAPVPVLQTNLEFSGIETKQRPCPFTPPQRVRLQV